MKSPPLARRPISRFAGRFLFTALVIFVVVAETRAQAGPDPAASYGTLMQRRMELSHRAVDETLRRRFEEGKGGSEFPSDAARKGAKTETVRAVSPAERKAVAHTEKGLARFERGKIEEAIKEYEEAIRVHPQLAAAHNNLGSALFALGRYAEAASSFERAIQHDPKYAQAHLNFGLSLLKLGREREANDSIIAAVQHYFLAGDEHFIGGRLKEAEESYDALLRIDPTYALAHLRLGMVYNAARRHYEAERRLAPLAARTMPDSALVNENLCEAQHGQRKHAEAVASCERAIRLKPDAAPSHYLSGLAHASLGQRDLALARHARLLELKADDYARLLLDAIEKRSPR